MKAAAAKPVRADGATAEATSVGGGESDDGSGRRGRSDGGGKRQWRHQQQLRVALTTQARDGVGGRGGSRRRRRRWNTVALPSPSSSSSFRSSPRSPNRAGERRRRSGKGKVSQRRRWTSMRAADDGGDSRRWRRRRRRPREPRTTATEPGSLNPNVLLELFSMYRDWQEEKAKKVSQKQEEIENKIETVDALAVKLFQRFNYSVSAMKTAAYNLSEVHPLQVEVGELKGRLTEVISNCDALCRRISTEGPNLLMSPVRPFSSNNECDHQDNNEGIGHSASLGKDVTSSTEC